MSINKKSWRTYEEVAQYLLNEFATHFELGRVEGKQIIPGASGTNWNIEAKGIAANGDGFFIIECRRYTKSSLNQERVAGLAYRIIDTGAKGGIIVSPLKLQLGAKKVAAYSNIITVTLNPQSTTTEYIMSFLNKVFMGFADKASVSDSATVTLIEQGKIIDKHNIDKA